MIATATLMPGSLQRMVRGERQQHKDMTENEITTRMQELPVDVRARCLLSAVQNIYRQANDLGLVSADEVETTIEMAWRDHKASNAAMSDCAGGKLNS